MKIYGYARVSTKGQDSYGNGLDVQLESLKERKCDYIYQETITGTKRDRPELQRMLSEIQKGDIVIVTKLDRIARSAKDGLIVIDEILGKGASVEILNMGKFDNTSLGKLTRTILLAFAEFERDIIVERTTMQGSTILIIEKVRNAHQSTMITSYITKIWWTIKKSLCEKHVESWVSAHISIMQK